MQDLPRCKNERCPMKSYCYRFTAPLQQEDEWDIYWPDPDGMCRMFMDQRVRLGGVEKEFDVEL